LRVAKQCHRADAEQRHREAAGELRCDADSARIILPVIHCATASANKAAKMVSPSRKPVTISMGLLDDVVLFTASNFGRTLLGNGQCSDHFVAGGAVRGRNADGRCPGNALGSADHVGSGCLLPSTSVIECAGGLGRWMGLSSTDAVSVLSSIGNVSSAGVGFI
jgi:hypothetical protein